MCTHPHWNDFYKEHSVLLILSSALCTNGASTPNPLGQPISTYHRRLCCCCWLYFLLCYDKKKKKDRSCTGRHKTQHALMHMATHFFFIWRHPPFQTRKYLPVYNFISLSLLSHHHHHHRKEKEKVLVAFFENISVADIFFKIKRWRDINISLSMYLRPYSMLVAQHKVQQHQK